MSDRTSLFRQEAVDHHFPTHEAAEVIRQWPYGGPLLTTLALAVAAAAVFLATATMKLDLVLGGTAVQQAIAPPAPEGCLVSFTGIVPVQRRELVRIGDVARLELASSNGGPDRISADARVTAIHEAPEAAGVTFDLRAAKSCAHLPWRGRTPLTVRFESERKVVAHLFAGDGH